jgi:hypothetical protein
MARIVALLALASLACAPKRAGQTWHSDKVSARFHCESSHVDPFPPHWCENCPKMGGADTAKFELLINGAPSGTIDVNPAKCDDPVEIDGVKTERGTWVVARVIDYPLTLVSFVDGAGKVDVADEAIWVADSVSLSHVLAEASQGRIALHRRSSVTP